MDERPGENEESHYRADKQNVFHSYLLLGLDGSCLMAVTRTGARGSRFAPALHRGYRSEATYRISSDGRSHPHSSIRRSAGRFARTHPAAVLNIRMTARQPVIVRQAPIGMRTSVTANSPTPTVKITVSVGHAGGAGEGRPGATRCGRRVRRATGRVCLSSTTGWSFTPSTNLSHSGICWHIAITSPCPGTSTWYLPGAERPTWWAHACAKRRVQRVKKP